MKTLITVTLFLGGLMAEANTKQSFVSFLNTFIDKANSTPSFLKEVYSYNKNISIDDNIKKYIIDEFQINGFKKINKDEIQCNGEYCIYNYNAPDDEQITYLFKFQDNNWYIWDESYNINNLKKTYAFQIIGAKNSLLDIGFNNNKVWINYKNLKDSSVISMNINGLLKKGKNEIHLSNPRKLKEKVQIYISSGSKGEIIKSNQGDIFKWEGIIEKDTTLSFDIEK